MGYGYHSSRLRAYYSCTGRILQLYSCTAVIEFIVRGLAENGRMHESQNTAVSQYVRVHASSTTSAHHLGKHEAKLATLEIMVRAIRTRKIWPLASPEWCVSRCVTLTHRYFNRHSHTFCMRAFCHYLHCLSMPKGPLLP